MINIRKLDRKNHSVSGIYEIRNLRNGKQYIGQTKNLYERQCTHIGSLNRGSHPNRHLQRAWDKYGSESFEFNVLEFCPIEQLNELEKWHIDRCQSNIIGYNIRIDPCSSRGLKWTDEQRRKMTERINEEGSWFRNHTIPRKTMEKAWEASRNKVWTKEERERHSKILTGTKVTDTSNMCAAQTGEKNGDARLTEQEAKQIIYLLGHGYKPVLLSSVYKVAFETITAIRHFRSWNHLNRSEIQNDVEIGKMAMEKLQKYIKFNLKPIEKCQKEKVYLSVCF